MSDERRTAMKVKTPLASDTVLFASVMAVAWACVTTAAWALLALVFGRSRGNGRLLTMLIIGAVVAAFLCGHAYRQGWKSRR
ncbi:MAG: hypothetical protein WAM71_19920 [Candidatus Korobacteraceae bacterium]